MAFYVIDQTTNDLIYVSDFEPPNEYAANGHSVFENAAVTADQLNAQYEWNKDQNTFLLKDTAKITKREFIKRFTVQEYATIKTAANANPTLDYYWQLFMLAEFISLVDPDTISGITMLEQVGLIGAGRSAEILSH